jgi:peroxiredoxin, OsmC subfamily
VIEIHAGGQLIAAAHAACFTMALSNILSAAGHTPELVRTSARVHLRNIDGAPTLARIDLETEGQVPGVDGQQFQRYADEAKANCPVSRALAGIPEIVLTAKLV